VRSYQKAWQDAQKRLEKTTAKWKQQMDARVALYQRLERFEQENGANLHPVEIDFRLDAGFGSYENVARSCEMGHEVYTKPHSHQVVTYLKQQVNDQTAWTRVGVNAELVSWPDLPLKKCPYPLDVAQNASTPAKLSSTALCSTSGPIPLQKICRAGSRSITVSKPLRPESKRVSRFSSCITSKFAQSQPSTYRNVSSSLPPTLSAGHRTGWQNSRSLPKMPWMFASWVSNARFK